VKGIHIPIIDEQLFYTVQEVMKGRTKFLSILRQREELPLRGYLFCKVCGTKMTGSSSRGNGGIYYYYHCLKGCHERFRADIANEVFVAQLSAFKTNEDEMAVYRAALEDAFQKRLKGQSVSVTKVKEEIAKNMTRLNSAQSLLLDGGLEVTEYKAIKTRYEGENAALQRQLFASDKTDSNFQAYVEYGAALVRGIGRYYSDAKLHVKQKVIGSFFPKPLVYENGAVRTNELNEGAEILSANSEAFRGNKNGLKANFCFQPTQAPPPGLEPGTP
jgi:site-specific DNA recombinase